MGWLPFGPRGGASGQPTGGAGASVAVCYSADGIKFSPVPFRADWLTSPVSISGNVDLVPFLSQLEEEGYADAGEDGLLLPWSSLYRLLESQAHGESCGLLELPPLARWTPSLESRGSLTDQKFTIAISGWAGPDGRSPQGNVVIEGATVKIGSDRFLLPERTWAAVQAVAAFHRRPTDARDAESNRRAWAAIRTHAMAAGANLSDFLAKTVVLTPERLKIDLRKADAAGNKVIEVSPGFAGQPARWPEIFDRFDEVPERYDIPDGNGIVHVLLSPEARTVLREIKRMPGRRIAGERAEAFVRNPFSALGPDAATVIDAEQFERARDDAGISFARFTAKVRRDEHGYPYECALLVEESLAGEIRAEELKFQGADDLGRFLVRLDDRIARGCQCCSWEGFDLEILGDTPDQASLLHAALEDLVRHKGFSAAEIFDLSHYSDRVDGIGVEKPYYSPFIARKNEEEGWFPENVEFGLCYTPEGGGETVAVVLNDETLVGFRSELEKAKEEGRQTFSFPGCPKPVPVDWAESAIATLGNASNNAGAGTFDPQELKTSGKGKERKGLVVKPNVDTLDYEERRGALVPPADARAVLPKSMRPEIRLKEHQVVGIAWLQHLWGKSPTDCRGALLADDMGLGKTLQLLCLMAAAIEENPDVDPFLVVAPVSLLENWKEEIDKFFLPGAMPVLTLYGPDLAGKRLPRQALDDALASAGIVRLLERDWIGGAKIVLTTYETLRDLEFSLAMQKWSAMVCDEAQKIKNPNAMVTRAAKKQNARFKIACTGTPVENTLTDIWCLFDFVQPGLLGALKDFGERYRKPIEAETEEEKSRVEELAALIEPQKLRRTKAEVAKDLPRKIEVPECRSLPISDRQRAHYADAVGVFLRRAEGGGSAGLQSHLGLIQYLRRLCSDPRPPGHIGTAAESIQDIVTHSPKMAWLVKQLKEIQEKGDKVIVFCEFRDLQRTLQRVIADRFGFTPDVINGDTSAASANANNRQRRIRAFQEKPGFGVIVLSPLAVGFGVNIQAANHVVHFSRTWNPAKEDQATDRAYRIGQTKDVFVYYPVVVASDFTTFDAKLDKLLDWKRGLSTNMLNGTGDISPSEFGDLEAPGGGSAFGNQVLAPDDIPSLDPDAFEAFCAIVWSKLGYTKTFRTPRSGDGGVDVVAIKGKKGVVVQCKSSGILGKELGWDAVKDVAAGSAGYAARYPGVSFSMAAATNQRFNGTARNQARLLHVELFDGEDFARMIEERPVRRGELASFLLAG